MINSLEIEASRRALVVLMHGFMGGRVQLIPMASMLSYKFDVLNYGYPSRADTIEGHAHTLLETIDSRMRQHDLKSHKHVHFVTHSFGGVVLHRAFADGLADVLQVPQATKCVMLAPPLRGATLARSFRTDQLVGPDFVRRGLNSLAQTILGAKGGAQLMTIEPHSFQETIGTIPSAVDVLVIAGNTGRINPLIKEESDGVVGISETMLNRPHFRKTITLTHNFLLLSRTVWRSVDSFLEGDQVGELHPLEEKL